LRSGGSRAVPLDSEPEALARVLLEELDLPSPAEPPKLPTWDDCADALLDLYQRVLDEPKGRR
jgi:hypothetical protein